MFRDVNNCKSASFAYTKPWQIPSLEHVYCICLYMPVVSETRESYIQGHPWQHSDFKDNKMPWDSIPKNILWYFLCGLCLEIRCVQFSLESWHKGRWCGSIKNIGIGKKRLNAVTERWNASNSIDEEDKLREIKLDK